MGSFLQADLTNNTMLQLGVGAIFALMVLKIVFDFIKDWKRNRDSSPPPKSEHRSDGKEDTLRMQMHDLHNHMLPSVNETLKELAANQTKLVDIVQRQDQTMTRQEQMMAKVVETNEEIASCQREFAASFREYMASRKVSDALIERIDRRISGVTKPVGGE
jgi:hypothetical protein